MIASLFCIAFHLLVQIVRFYAPKGNKKGKWYGRSDEVFFFICILYLHIMVALVVKGSSYKQAHHVFR